MIRDEELEQLDDWLSELTQVEVEPPPWSAVVDRIAVSPQPAPRRLSVGWSAVIAGGVVAVAAAIGGAVSEPVRETVFEPVANLLPWVDDGPDEPIVPTTLTPAVEDPENDGVDDRLSTDVPRTTVPPTRTTLLERDVDERETTPVDESDRTPVDSGDRDLDERDDGGSLDDIDRSDLTPEQIERLRRAREQARREAIERERAATSTTAPTTTVGDRAESDADGDARTRD